MKKSNILLFIVMGISVFFLTSYESGPAHHSGLNCSGSESDFNNPVGCSSGSCHGTTPTAGIVVTIEVDSAGGVPVTQYKGGLTYTVKLTGKNTTTNSDPYFGFQITAITGSSRVVTPTNAGTWQQTGLPTGVRYSPASPGSYLANVVEHSTALSASSGSGAAGTIYTESITWTAPAAGTGTISFWAALNIVDGLDVASGLIDFWNTQSLVLEEDTSTATAVNPIADNLGVNIYPNPASNFTQLELDNAPYGLYQVSVFDAEGRKISCNTLDFTGSAGKMIINTSNLKSGIYLLQITNGNQQKVIRLVKNQQ